MLHFSSNFKLNRTGLRHECPTGNYVRLTSLTSHIKVKCTLVQALRLCTGRTAHRGSRGIALLFHDHGTRRGWGVSVAPRPFFTPGKGPIPTVQEAGWDPGPVSTGAENLAPPPTEIRYPDRPARSQSLYRLSYPAHNLTYWVLISCENYWLPVTVGCLCYSYNTDVSEEQRKLTNERCQIK